MWGHLGAHAPSPPPPPSHSYAPRCRSSLSSCFLAMNVIKNWEWPEHFSSILFWKDAMFFFFFFIIVWYLVYKKGTMYVFLNYWNILKINNYRTDDHTLRNWKQLVLFKKLFLLRYCQWPYKSGHVCEEKKYPYYMQMKVSQLMWICA